MLLLLFWGDPPPYSCHLVSQELGPVSLFYYIHYVEYQRPHNVASLTPRFSPSLPIPFGCPCPLPRDLDVAWNALNWPHLHWDFVVGVSLLPQDSWPSPHSPLSGKQTKSSVKKHSGLSSPHRCCRHWPQRLLPTPHSCLPVCLPHLPCPGPKPHRPTQSPALNTEILRNSFFRMAFLKKGRWMIPWSDEFGKHWVR